MAIARSEGPLLELKSKYGNRVEIIVGDVCDLAISQAAVATAVEKFGQLNSVIANAGVILPVHTQVEKVDIDEWKKLFDINYFSVIQLTQCAIAELRKSHGNLVVVSLGASTSAYSGWFAYGNSKAAINLFVQHLAAEEKDVTAISVAPGVVDTGMQADIRGFGNNMSKEHFDKFTSFHENKQLLPAEVPAKVYVKLALNGWSLELNGKYLRYDDEVFV